MRTRLRASRLGGRSWTWYRRGGWQWSDCDIYHVEKYDLEPDPEFVAYALSHLNRQEIPLDKGRERAVLSPPFSRGQSNGLRVLPFGPIGPLENGFAAPKMVLLARLRIHRAKGPEQAWKSIKNGPFSTIYQGRRWGSKEGVRVCVCMFIDVHTHIYEHTYTCPQYRWNRARLPKVSERNDAQAAKRRAPRLGEHGV